MVQVDEGKVVKAGSLIENNDPRVKPEYKRVRVVEVLGGYAYYQSAKRRAKIALNRIFNDGKPRRQGYSVVTR